MLKPIKSPLPCYSLEYDSSDPDCLSCPHRISCASFSCTQEGRVSLAGIRFSLVPQGFIRRWEETDQDRRDNDAIYAACYTEIFGSPLPGTPMSVGKYWGKIVNLAAQAECSPELFIFSCMFAHKESQPDALFTPSMLSDGRALHRVSTYAEACRSRYSNFSARSLRSLTQNLEAPLATRMLRSEIKAGKWIIECKLWNSIQPYASMFQAIEKDLDPCWLAVEGRYSEAIQTYSIRADDRKHQELRHATLKIFARIKKHKHEAIAHFRAREQAMPEAVATVLESYGLTPQDFEMTDKPVTDPLWLWNKLALAVQHLECLKTLYLNNGIYSR